MSTPKFVFLQQPPTCPAPGTDWEMWSAVATAAATLVALGVPLFLHFHAERGRKRQHAETVRRRTGDVAPQLAGDVMRIFWGLLSVMRSFESAARSQGQNRLQELEAKYKGRHLVVGPLPASEVFPADVELLSDGVRAKLAALKAQVTVLNGMVDKTMIGPVDPFDDRAKLVDAQLLHLAGQCVATFKSGLSLMEELHDYLPPDLRILEVSLRANEVGFNRILTFIRDVHQREQPPQPAN